MRVLKLKLWNEIAAFDQAEHAETELLAAFVDERKVSSNRFGQKNQRCNPRDKFSRSEQAENIHRAPDYSGFLNRLGRRRRNTRLAPSISII